MQEKLKKYMQLDELKRMIRFGLVGVSNTAVDFIVFYVATTFLGINVYFSQVASYSIATLNSYVLNKNWTFRSKGGDIKKEFIKFLAVNLTSLSLSLVLMWIFHDIMGLQKMVCKVLIACFTILINYFGNRIWVFRKK